ncbi:hypothetical protein AB3Y40_13310 [Yoonia sp. R2331]|uniref:hypothetical protein n=1 Tax=Yoonia sp. R2331 TaxID=3237238 RepID=UPI0034E3EE2B
MAAAHGVPIQRDKVALELRGDPPPYHGHMVALDPAAGQELRARVAAHHATPGFAIKDSFACLDLARLGLSKMFAAQWFWADHFAPVAHTGWQHITQPAALRVWENAWKAGGSPSDQRQFPDSVLQRADIAFWGRAEGAGFSAGAVLNHSADCIGLSNVFGPEVLPGFAHIAAQSGKPIVGYAHGDHLRDVQQAGFTLTGPLQVWGR